MNVIVAELRMSNDIFMTHTKKDIDSKDVCFDTHTVAWFFFTWSTNFCPTGLHIAAALLTHLGIEPSCAALGSSWDPATCSSQPETPGATPWPLPCLPCQPPLAAMDRETNRLIRGTPASVSAPGSLPRSRESSASAGGSSSLPLSVWSFIRRYFATTVLTSCSNELPKIVQTFKLHWQINSSCWQHVPWNLIQSSKCTLMLTVVSYANRWGQTRTPCNQCMCSANKSQRFNHFWPGEAVQESSACSPLTPSDTPAIARQKAQRQLIKALLSSQFSSILN